LHHGNLQVCYAALQSGSFAPQQLRLGGVYGHISALSYFDRRRETDNPKPYGLP
jgi:hypothetical protein